MAGSILSGNKRLINPMIPRSVLSKIKLYQSAGKKIVLVGGCFDIIHPGHIAFLKKAKEAGDVLVVLLESDESVIKFKKILAQTQNDRAQILKSLKSPDLVILLKGILTDEQYYMIVNSVKPDIIAVTENDPYLLQKTRQAKNVGGELKIVTKRIQQYASSKLKNRLKK